MLSVCCTLQHIRAKDACQKSALVVNVFAGAQELLLLPYIAVGCKSQPFLSKGFYLAVPRNCFVRNSAETHALGCL